jgi:hypothetical protein
MHDYLIRPSGPLELDPGRNLLFGRGGENDIVIDDIRASRLHAELRWDGSGYLIEDKGSSNGTFVNGRPVKATRLNDGDVVQIGSALFTYRRAGSLAELQISEDRTEATFVAERPAALWRGETMPEEFQGSLASMPVSEICQLLHMTRRTGCLRLDSPDDGSAALHFRSGQIVHAGAPKLSGEAAAFHALGLKDGTFVFSGEPCGETPNITLRTEALLIEAARRTDESGRG